MIEYGRRALALVFLVLGATGAPAWAAVDEEDLLPPEAAFAASGYAESAERLTVQFDIAENYYLYRHAFKFNALEPQVTLGEPEIPPGETHYDEFFGEVQTYRGRVAIGIPVSYAGGQASEMITLEVTSQGCADIGVCYPPLTQAVAVNPADIRPAGTGPGPATAEPDKTGAAPPVAKQDRIAASLMDGASVLTLLTFFGFGLLLAFTPCVFPMIPILSGLIIGQGDQITTRKAFVLSLVYVLAMAVTYTAAGVLVGLSGENIQIWFQNPWVLSVFAGIFVLLSLAMFGFYELQMPAAVQSRLSAISNRQQGGTLIGAGIMGFLSALIVGPCVTAPLIGALIYIAHTGDAVLGGAALFALSLGMGVPLIIIGTSAGKWLPRAGSWMHAVKALFGVLLLALAIWLLSRVLPAAVTMALYAVLAIASAIYLGALDAVPADRSGWYRLWKALGVVLLVYGVLLLIGAAAGKGNALQPLKGLWGGAAVSTGAHLDFQPVKGLEGLERALAAAEQNGRPVMLDLYADWCISCKEMEAFTFTDADVQKALAPFTLVQADVTANDEQDRALMKFLGVFGPPAIVFYGPGGNEAEGFRVFGYMNAGEFARHVEQVKARML